MKKFTLCEWTSVRARDVWQPVLSSNQLCCTWGQKASLLTQDDFTKRSWHQNQPHVKKPCSFCSCAIFWWETGIIKMSLLYSSSPSWGGPLAYFTVLQWLCWLIFPFLAPSSLPPLLCCAPFLGFQGRVPERELCLCWRVWEEYTSSNPEWFKHCCFTRCYSLPFTHICLHLLLVITFTLTPSCTLSVTTTDFVPFSVFILSSSNLR